MRSDGVPSDIEPLELDETKHNEAAAEVALPRIGDDQGREGSGIKFVSFCRDRRVAIVGDMGDIGKGGEGPEVPALPRSSTFASGAAMEGCELSGSSTLQSRR